MEVLKEIPTFLPKNIWLTVEHKAEGPAEMPILCFAHSLQAMTNDSDLNMGNNIGKRDTQFFGMFWLKTLEN